MVNNILFLVGVCGTGHHLLAANKKNNFHNQTLSMLFHKYFDYNISPLEKNNVKKKILDFDNFNLCIAASFPYQTQTDALKYFNILEVFNLFQEMKNLNYYFLVLTRDIIYSTLSIYDRWTNISVKYSILRTKEIIENNLNIINNQIQILPKKCYMIVSYDNICNNFNKFKNDFKEKTKMNFFIENSNVKKSSKIYENHPYFTLLKSYYTENNLKQFTFLYNNINFYY